MKLSYLLIAFFLFTACETLIPEDDDPKMEASLKSVQAEDFSFEFYDVEDGSGGAINDYIWNTVVPDPPGRLVFNHGTDWGEYASYVIEDNGVFSGFTEQDPENASDYRLTMNWGHSFSADQDFIYYFHYRMNVRAFGAGDPPRFTANNLAGGDYDNPYIDSTGGDEVWTKVVLTGYPNANDQGHVYFFCRESNYIEDDESFLIVDRMGLLPQEPVITVDSVVWNDTWGTWAVWTSVPDYFEDYEWDQTGAVFGGEVVGSEHRAAFSVLADETVTIENRIKYDGVWYGWHDIEVTAPDSTLVYKSDFSSSTDGWTVYWGTNGAGTMGYSNDELTIDYTTYATKSSVVRPVITHTNVLESGKNYSIKIEGTGQIKIVYYNSTGSTATDTDLNNGPYVLSDVTANLTYLKFYFNGVATHGGYNQFEITDIEIWEKV